MLFSLPLGGNFIAIACVPLSVDMLFKKRNIKEFGTLWKEEGWPADDVLSRIEEEGQQKACEGCNFMVPGWAS